ncbi:MAG TPA: O-antigen ligase family protein [Candidatus Acidoferrum sp.]
MWGKALGLARQASHREAIAGLDHTGRSQRISKNLLIDQTSQPSIHASLLYKHPTVIAASLFLLILSGPPKFRVRDPAASLRGDTDWVVILHVVVWGLAGLWVLLQICKRFQAKRPLLRLRLPQILGLALIVGLAASAWVSDAPALTTFKVYQMLVSLLFTQIFVERFGPRTTLKAIFWGNFLLCIAIAICALLAPDLVWGPSDFSWDPSRLRGDLIAPTGVVSTTVIILLLASVRKVWRALPLLLVCFLLGLLALSLMRTAYAVILVFFILVFLRHPNPKPLRHFAYLLCTTVAALYAYHWIPSLSKYRDPETIFNLSDRIGLWNYLSNVTLNHSPWLGLGYYSASRIYGLEYNAGLGTAHSILFEVLLGGGIPSFVSLLVLCLTLFIYVCRLLWVRRDRFSFAVSSLFVACVLFGCMGEEIDSGPTAINFWYSVAVLPCLYERFVKRTSLRAEARKRIPMSTNPVINQDIL